MEHHLHGRGVLFESASDLGDDGRVRRSHAGPGQQKSDSRGRFIRHTCPASKRSPKFSPFLRRLAQEFRLVPDLLRKTITRRYDTNRSQLPAGSRRPADCRTVWLCLPPDGRFWFRGERCVLLNWDGGQLVWIILKRRLKCLLLARVLGRTSGRQLQAVDAKLSANICKCVSRCCTTSPSEMDNCWLCDIYFE